MQAIQAVLRCWWSGLTEALVAVESLQAESLLTVPTQGPWCGGVMLSLMVDPTCLVQGLEGAASMAAVQSILSVNKILELISVSISQLSWTMLPRYILKVGDHFNWLDHLLDKVDAWVLDSRQLGLRVVGLLKTCN